jgi:hypothetical protein
MSDISLKRYYLRIIHPICLSESQTCHILESFFCGEGEGISLESDSMRLERETDHEGGEDINKILTLNTNCGFLDTLA